MDDLISRQAAIETLMDMNGKRDSDGYVLIYRCDACDNIYNLPSVQPEIIRCKDCIYWDFSGYCVDFMTQDENGFCSWAERKIDD